MAGPRNPDIQRLLASLRNASSEGHPTTSSNSSDYLSDSRSSTPGTNMIPGLGMLQPLQNHEPQSKIPPKPSTPQPIETPPRPDVPRDRPSTPSIPDASTIITWPAALKHVTKHITTNEKATSKIKHLISEQHKHERQWWAGREAIVARQSGRAGNQAKVADLLKSLGGATIPVAAQDPKADQAELEAYDKKVYKSLTDMTADFDRQLRVLQIPFFAIKHDLVILGDGVQKDTEGKIDKGELRELQRRMTETLEDLFGED